MAEPKLTPEELEILDSLDEDSRRNIIQLPAEMRAPLLRMKKSMLIEGTAKKQAEEIRDAILPGGEPHPEQLKLFAPFPTELTRTSPFFPMGTKEMAQREYIRDMVIADHSWGTIRYSGPKLSVFEEDMLIILLAALNEANSRQVAEVEGQTTYTYRGSMLQLLRLKGIHKPGKNHYDDALSAFKLMTGARFDLITTKQGPKGKKIPKKTFFKNLITGGEYDHETGEFSVTVNPFFYEAYAAGSVTWIDAVIRAKINSPIAKALYRFIHSHRDDEWRGPLMTLASALNLDLTLPKAKIRERLKNSIKELVGLDILADSSKVEKESVTLIRQANSRELQKLPLKKKVALSDN